MDRPRIPADMHLSEETSVPQIRANGNVWRYDPNKPLGKPGGFGAVYAGWSSDGEEVAIKLLSLETEDAGHRELSIAEELRSRTLRYVIPFLDSGVDEASGQYFVVMPRAERSLQSLIDEMGPMEEARAVPVLKDIVCGLRELEELVHRDLKPGNVLLHDRFWKIADLGIAKFVADTTSARTLRDCLSAPYAAPEQWRRERSTNATDVYSFGCMIYSLITGNPPFLGPYASDFRRQHLDELPPPLPASARLQQIASMCLQKHPEARPSIESVKRLLDRAGSASGSPARNALADAAARIAAQNVEKGAKEAQIQRVLFERKRLAAEAVRTLDLLIDGLLVEIEADAVMAERFVGIPGSDGTIGVRLGSGTLFFKLCYPLLDRSAFPESKWDVAAGAVIGVTQECRTYPGRSANLWFADIANRGAMRWLEVPYMTQPLVPSLRQAEPFGFQHELELAAADLAAAPIVAGYQLASEPTPIDLEYRDEFYARWKDRLALASRNALSRPSSLPERSG